MATERPLDVSLAQYAAVLAALAEGHELARVLAHEGIDPAHWPVAQEAWAESLAKTGGLGSRIQEQFDGHLAAAQDRYARRLSPIEDDLRAFLDFRRRWSTDDDPPALLARLGLRLTEVARLARRWSARIAADPALAEAAQSILGEEPGELPVITPARVELPAALMKAHVVATTDEEEEDEAQTIEDLPAFAAVSSAAKQEGEEPLPPSSAEAQESAGVPEPVVSVPVRRPRPSFLLTKAFVATMAKPALPFRPDAAPPAASTPNVAATAMFSVPSFAPVVPFGERRAAPLHAAMTAPVSILPASILPFQALEAARNAAMTKPVSPGVTAELDGAAIADALPFVSTEPAMGPSGTAPMQALTSAPEASTSKPKKKLSLGAYAAFCAELAAFPEQFGETFQRYGLTSPEEGLELASVWQERFEKAPAEFDTWQRLHAFFLEQCRTKGRPEVLL